MFQIRNARIRTSLSLGLLGLGISAPILELKHWSSGEICQAFQLTKFKAACAELWELETNFKQLRLWLVADLRLDHSSTSSNFLRLPDLISFALRAPQNCPKGRSGDPETVNFKGSCLVWKNLTCSCYVLFGACNQRLHILRPWDAPL